MGRVLGPYPAPCHGLLLPPVRFLPLESPCSWVPRAQHREVFPPRPLQILHGQEYLQLGAFGDLALNSTKTLPGSKTASAQPRCCNITRFWCPAPAPPAPTFPKSFHRAPMCHIVPISSPRGEWITGGLCPSRVSGGRRSEPSSADPPHPHQAALEGPAA